MTKPTDIKERIRRSYTKLPSSQRRIADYFVDHFDRIPFLNVQEIAGAIPSSDASIVRFAQRIGFEGFKELQEEIGLTLQHRLRTGGLFSVPASQAAADDLLTAVARQDVKNINETLDLIERERFEAAVEAIMRARHVYTAGLGISYLLAEVLSYQLTQVGVPSSPLRQGPLVFAEQVLYFRPEDALICFSFPPYSVETIDTARFVHERGNTVIAVTDKMTAPITFSATLSLLVKSHNMLYTNSFAAISVVINALSTACALKDKPRAESIANDLNELTRSTTILP